jgi:D-alanyl-D-alanine carboxypeptidase (penicillin-binding protein 5/6)
MVCFFPLSSYFLTWGDILYGSKFGGSDWFLTAKTPQVLLWFLLFLWFTGAAVSEAATGKLPGVENDVFYQYEPGFPASVAANNGKNSTVGITADAAVLMDADTGQLLYAKNPHRRMPIASTTKIMTALLAIECGNLGSPVMVSSRAAGVEGSSIYLRAGESLVLEELVYGALMHSGNDACVAIAEHVASREDIFVQWMNLRAGLLGLKNTTFMNTNGLPHKDHLSSAFDLAVIARSALHNPVFKKIVSTKYHEIKGPGGKRHLSNTNQLLWGYQGADGVKTGTTNAAGKCLVSSASRDGRRLIAVVLHSADRYGDSTRLLDHGFNGFKNELVVQRASPMAFVKVSNGVAGLVPAGCTRDIVVAVPVGGEGHVERIVKKEAVVTAPVAPGQVLGSLLVLVNGEPVAGSDLTAVAGVEKLSTLRRMYGDMKERFAH